MKRGKFEPEFRAEAVRLVREQGRAVADVARSLGFHVNTPLAAQRPAYPCSAATFPPSR